jgi:hypothetical protein
MMSTPPKEGGMSEHILDRIGSFLGRFIAYPSEHALVAHVLWVAHTHLMSAWQTTPRLAFMSAERASGKTRALEITDLLAHGSVFSVNASPAYLVRRVSSGDCTLIFDEVDALFGNARREEANSELRSVLNAGYRRGAKVHRCVGGNGKRIELEELEAFAPVALAGLRELPDTLASRSIIIRMKRRAPDEKVEPFRYPVHAGEGHALQEELHRWMYEHEDALTNAEPEFPPGVEDRAADCWEPLLAVADATGGDWPARARAAAQHFTSQGADEMITDGVELLEHIRDAFAGETQLPTTVLLQRLLRRDESPWRDIGGRPLDDRGLAKRLKPYGIKSKVIRVGEKTPRGYSAMDFADAWARYLRAPSKERNKRNNYNNFDNENNSVADVADVADGYRKGQEPRSRHAADDDRIEVEERAAILEYNGGLSRAEARAGTEFPELPEFLDRRRIGTYG